MPDGYQTPTGTRCATSAAVSCCAAGCRGHAIRGAASAPDLQVESRIAGTDRRLGARWCESLGTGATRATLTDAPFGAIERIGVPRIVGVAVEFIGARVRFHEKPARQAGFAEHAAIGGAGLTSTNMTAGHSWGDSVGIDPPSCFSLDPVIWLELDRPYRTGNAPCANGGWARSLRASESPWR